MCLTLWIGKREYGEGTQYYEENCQSPLNGLVFFFYHHENIFVLLFHEELLAGIFLQVILVGGKFVKADGILLDLLQVILPVVFQLPDLFGHLQTIDHIVLVEEKHPYGKHRDGEYILILKPGPYFQKDLLHKAKLYKKATSLHIPYKSISTRGRRL